MAVTNCEKMKTELAHNVWLKNVWVLILLIWILWLEADTCCKGKFCDTVESLIRWQHSLTPPWPRSMNWIRLKSLIWWQNGFITFENVWIKLLIDLSVSCLTCTYFFTWSFSEWCTPAQSFIDCDWIPSIFMIILYRSKKVCLCLIIQITRWWILLWIWLLL